MPLVELEGDRVICHAPYRQTELTHQVPGMKYDRDTQLWSCPISWAACVQLKGVFREELEVGPKLRAWADDEYSNRVGPALFLRDAPDAPANLPFSIYRAQDLEPRQRAGVAFLVYAQGALLGDGMGSGKTVELICATETLHQLGDEQYPALIVCPNSMVYKWVAEWETWAPHRKVVAIKGSATKRRKIIERLKPCPVHGVPQRKSFVEECVSDVMTQISLNEILDSKQDNEQYQPNGIRILKTDLTNSELDGPRTSNENSHLPLRSMDGSYTIKDSSAAYVEKMMNLEESSELITTTQQDKSEACSVSDVTPLSNEKIVTQDGLNEHGCTCADRAQVAIINWEGLRTHTRIAPYGYIRLSEKEKEEKELNGVGLRRVIADEAHRAKNPRALQTRAWWWLAWHAGTADAATGTPIANTPEDAWSIMHGVAPREFPSKTAFIERYALQCTPPDSMVWMQDGTFKQIGDVKVGDYVQGFSTKPLEGQGKHPYVEPTLVTGVHRGSAPLVRVETDTGNSFLCTPTHRWMAGWSRATRNGPREMRFRTPSVGVELRKVIDVPPPLSDDKREMAAWLGGIYDGEASGLGIAQSSTANPDVFDRIGEVLSELGFSFRATERGYLLHGGRDAYAKLMHYTRPVKRHFTHRGERYPHMHKQMFAGSLAGRGRQNKEYITSVTPAGEGEVVALTTELGTYTVHGYASHNSWNNFGGMTVVGLRGETREEFFQFFDARFIRRPTEVVIPNIAKKLPPQVREIDLIPKQRKAYDAIRKEMLADLESGVLVATNPLARMTRLLQLSSAYGEIDAEGNFKLAEPSCKLDALDELYDELAGEPLVAFAESRQLIELAATRFTKAQIPHGLIVGGMGAKKQHEMEQAFQRGDFGVLLVTLGAGGEGLTLTASRFPVFLQWSPSMLKDWQAIDRTWRRGQTRTVQPIIFRARDTYESHIAELVVDKEIRFEEIARDKETLRRLLS